MLNRTRSLEPGTICANSWIRQNIFQATHKPQIEREKASQRHLSALLFLGRRRCPSNSPIAALSERKPSITPAPNRDACPGSIKNDYVPRQHNNISEIRSFEKWLVRSGVWLAQPLLALLTTCGTTAPGGLKAGTGADGTGADIPVAFGGREHVAPSEYPTDEALAEMVDSYEALVCWFYLPDDGRSDSSSGGGSNSSNSENDGGGGGVGGRGYGSEIACFVAYRDEGTRRSDGVDDPAADNNGRDGEPGKDASRLADLEAKRAAIAARARDRRRRGVAGGSQRSGSSASGGSDDGSSDSDSDGGGEAVNDDELDAEDFDPGALRVRLLLASPGTTQQLRKATGAFLKAIGNRNPVSGAAEIGDVSRAV